MVLSVSLQDKYGDNYYRAEDTELDVDLYRNLGDSTLFGGFVVKVTGRNPNSDPDFDRLNATLYAGNRRL